MDQALFYPDNVAIVGASKTSGKVGHDIVVNLVRGGYRGEIFPCNPSALEIFGLPCYSGPKQVGKKVDLAVIVLPRLKVLDSVRESISAGVRAVIVISSGFRECDPEGAETEKELAELCRRHKVSLLGPNCLGLINTDNLMNASFAGNMPAPGNISVISQSGALCAAILDSAAYRHLGLAKIISIGNKADLDESDLLLQLAEDDKTSVIIAYLEDIAVGNEFVKAATEASSSKPVIILKSGTTPAGQKAASSHTGVLAGAEIAYGAAFKRSGVIRADTYEDLFDYATAFAMQPLPRGNRILIVTNAGGPGTMAADSVEKSGMRVAMLDRNTSTALREKLPATASINNPVDVLGDAPPERYAAVITAAQNDEYVDGIIVLLTPQTMTLPAETARAVASCLQRSKPVVAAFMGGAHVLPGREELSAAGLPDYPSPERAVEALKAMVEYSSWLKRPPRVVTRFRVNRRRVERIITRRIRTGRHNVGEVKAKNILQAYGFQIPEGYLATSSREAMEVAERLGYPVAMKIVSPDIIHKSDLGGVRLNVTNSEGVRDAFDLMMLRIRENAPRAWIDGIYVEKMVDRGLEVIIGMNRDPQFGPMLMFGLGGIFVEVMKDVTFYLAPITEEEAIQMLMSTRSYEILKGKRGQKEVELSVIANGLQRISQLTTDFPKIKELDINPFIVGEPGTDPIVADARITLDIGDR
ncbi:MAG: acetate--CoA ligase family protein [Desulfurivibrionaceae bacterium]